MTFRTKHRLSWRRWLTVCSSAPFASSPSHSLKFLKPCSGASVSMKRASREWVYCAHKGDIKDKVPVKRFFKFLSYNSLTFLDFFVSCSRPFRSIQSFYCPVTAATWTSCWCRTFCTRTTWLYLSLLLAWVSMGTGGICSTLHYTTESCKHLTCEVLRWSIVIFCMVNRI